jgi:hypothetical protein
MTGNLHKIKLFSEHDDEFERYVLVILTLSICFAIKINCALVFSQNVI